MYTVTTEQMNKIHASMSQPLEAQNAVFESLELNPYDNYENSEPEFLLVIQKEDINDFLRNVQEHPDEYEFFPKERNDELKNSSQLTPEEIMFLKQTFIKDVMADECSECAAVARLTDGNLSFYAVYYEAVWGQGGLNINKFFGFFRTDEAARDAMNNQKDVLIIDGYE